MTKKLLFVINRGSGRKTKKQDQIFKLINDFCNKHALEFEIYKTTGKNDPDNIKKIIADFNPQSVIAVGGDGTVNIVGSLILNSGISLGIIPMGSANGLAKDLRIPLNPMQALEVIRDNQIHAIDTLSINENYCFHISDLGYNAGIVRRFASSSIRGRILYIWFGLIEFFTLKPFHYLLKYDGQEIEGDAFMIIVTNVNRLGTNVNINPLGENDDGYFEICIFKPFHKLKSFGILYRLLNNSIFKSKYNLVVHCREANINNIENTSFHIDGDPIQLPKIIQVKILPKALKVIVPLERI
jgi:diacylglycerol kinase (ATP)